MKSLILLLTSLVLIGCESGGTSPDPGSAPEGMQFFTGLLTDNSWTASGVATDTSTFTTTEFYWKYCLATYHSEVKYTESYKDGNMRYTKGTVKLTQKAGETPKVNFACTPAEMNCQFTISENDNTPVSATHKDGANHAYIEMNCDHLPGANPDLTFNEKYSGAI